MVLVCWAVEISLFFKLIWVRQDGEQGGQLADYLSDEELLSLTPSGYVSSDSEIIFA